MVAGPSAVDALSNGTGLADGVPPAMTPQEREAMLHRQERIQEKIEKERARKEEERGEALARFGKPIPKAKKMISEKEAALWQR